MDEVPVQEYSRISDTTPISKSIIYEEDFVQSDFNKAAASIEGHYPFSQRTKSKGFMDEEVQFVMSQIDLLSENESGTKTRKTVVPVYDFQTPPNLSPQRSKFLFETSIHSSNSKKQSGLAGKSGIRTSGEMRRSTRTTGLFTPRSTQSSRKRQINTLISHLVDNTMPGNILPWDLEHHLNLVYSSQVTVIVHSVPQNEKELQPAKTRLMSKKRAEKSEEWSLIKKRGFAIRSWKSFTWVKPLLVATKRNLLQA
jgi:hypothetical protein